MADVPYRLWSEEGPEPAPPERTIVAKLKPSTREGRRASGLRSGPSDDDRHSRVERLIENARVRAIRPVFPEEALRAPSRSSRALRSTRSAGATRASTGAVRHASGLVTVEVPRGEDPRRMARHLASIGGEVEYAYVPVPRRMFAKKKARKKPKSKLDPLLSRQWGHNAIHLPQARARAGFADARQITVAVADSGIDLKHPDLASIVSEYKNFVRGEGARDYEGHGTHVAGIIAAVMNNGVGIAGVCAAKILAMKVLPSRADWDPAGYYRALAYCIGRARVLNLSLGEDQYDPGEEDVINDLLDEGIVVIAAMGNEYEDGNPTEYPAALDGVCAVGATDQADRRGEFSNTGPHISLSAPGVSIVSTTPTYTYARGASDYDTFDGTSMATPHVAAAAALILADDPDLTPAQVIRKLERSADRVSGMKKRPSPSYGYGRLNIDRALR